MRLFVAAVTLALLVAGSQQIPPRTSGVVAGVIVGQFGSPVTAAIVQLRVDGRAQRSAASNDTGEFRFERVSPGTYEVYATKREFSPASVQVTVGDASPSPIKLTLFPATAEQQRVKAETQLRDELRSRAGQAQPLASVAERVAGFVSRGADLRRYAVDFNTEAYDRIDENRFHRVADDPLSTFDFGTGRDHNFFAWAQSSCQGQFLVVVSLMKDDDVEVRLMAPPGPINPQTGAPFERPQFAVFLLNRQKDDCL